ncbi:MAG TPA: NAD(P)/FAD-dependent oxidoreductase [Pseudonocardia sp.]|nr:NAD(P)/FAD-dependent oxidoreductase [Pseudonocardia sp.]
MNAVDTTADVVVIGAGHNGLTAANYLADAGRRVVVLEAAAKIGGMTSSDFPIPEAPQHMVNFHSADLLFWQMSPVEEELRLREHGLVTIPVDPSYVYLHPDGASIAIWQDPRKTADEIRRFSPHDADAYLEYARFLEALSEVAMPFMRMNPARPGLDGLRTLAKGAFRTRRELRRFAEFLIASGEESIEQRFEHPVTRSLLYCLCAGANPIEAAGTSVTHLFLAMVRQGGATRGVGGMQAIPEALARRLRSVGGEIRTDCAVAEIVVSGGRATGVRLADGREIRAREAVIATCHPRTALGTMLPSGTLSPELENRVRHIPASSAGAGAMKSDLALSGRLRLTRFEKWRGDGVDLRKPVGLIGTCEGLRRGYRRSAAGLVPEPDEIGLWPVILNAVDPTQAPDGQDSLYLYATNMPVDPDGGWEMHEKKAADNIVARTAEFYEGIEELEIGRWVQTPDRTAAMTGSVNGTAMHVDHLLLSQGPLRPAIGLGGISMPVEGLYLGGAGAHPGGGVSGLPGRLSARTVLKKSGSKHPGSKTKR